MSTLESKLSDGYVAASDIEPAERPVLRRTFEAEITPGDGRTVDVRIVPYGERGMANDGYGGVPKGVMYEEEWVRGAFSHQEKAANRVLVNFEHQPGIGGIVGHGVMLRDAPDALYGSLKLHETADGDKALMLVREKVLGHVSLEAHPIKTVRTPAGLIRRVKGHLVGVALARTAAFASAQVLALREHIIEEEILPLDPDPELIARCQRLGIELPQRYQAHPAESDTPPEGGTSEAAPVDGTETPTSEE